jgi:glutathione synthase
VNEAFFKGDRNASIYTSSVTSSFAYNPSGDYFHHHSKRIDQDAIDAIFIRMPQPLNPDFLLSLHSLVAPERIINKPLGIIETSNKTFLLKVPEICPDPVLCNTLQEAIDLSHEREIVLKPLYSYGGQGIIRLSKDYGWLGNNRYPISEIQNKVEPFRFPMVALTYLKNVSHGDKRTIVVNRRIVGSALRLPAPGSWMCNVAQGGHAVLAEADQDEHYIEEYLTPLLYEKGIVMYGFDTLVDDHGKRVLSEINTLSIGGLLPMQQMSGRPIIKDAATLLWDYLEASFY